MLTVDVDTRITIDQCLEHPWVLNNTGYINPADSTDGLTGELGKLDFSKRKVQRERTLLSTINDVKVSKIIESGGLRNNGQPDHELPHVHVKVWDKNPQGKKQKMTAAKANGKEGDMAKGTMNDKKKEAMPAADRATEEFMEMGGKGDMQLFGDDASSRYVQSEVPETNGD